MVFAGLRGTFARATPGRLLYGADEELARLEAGKGGLVQVRDSDTEPWRDAPTREVVSRRG